MKNVEIHLLMLTENTHLIEKIVHEGEVIAEFNKEFGNIDLSGLFILQEKENTGILITTYKDNLKETERKPIHFTVSFEYEGYAINIF